MRLLLLIFLMGLLGFGQTSSEELDTLLLAEKKSKTASEKLDLYIKIAKLCPNLDPPTGLVYGNKAIKLAQQLKATDQWAQAEMALGSNYYNLGDIEKAKQLYLSGQRKAHEKGTLAESYNLIGKYYLAKADYSQALNFNLKALQISEEAHSDVGVANASYTIAIAYNYLKEPQKSLAYFKKALALNQKLQNQKGIRSNLVGIASQYEYLNNFSLAKKYYLQAKAIADKSQDDFAIATTSSSLGNLLFRMNETDAALQNIIVSREAAERINNARAINTAKFLEGRIYLKLYQQGKSYRGVNLLQEAEKLLVDAIETEKSTGNKIVITQGLEQLAEVYSLRRDYKKAKDTYVLYMKYTDSIYNEESKQTIQSLEDQRTIELKNKEIQLNKLKLANQEKEKWFFIAGILLLSVIGGLLFYQSRSRSKTNQKLQRLNAELDQANKTKTRFFSILNHDLRGPISNLIHFLHLQKENPELLDNESRKRMEAKTITGAENLLQSMEDMLLWSKGQMENFKPQPVKIPVSACFEDLQKHFAAERNTAIHFEDPDALVVETDENYLKTIMRNLTGNAIKALQQTPQPTIGWKAWKQGQKICLSITDNGPGADQEAFRALYDQSHVVGIKTGLGLHLIRDLAKAINCQISVESKKGKGTTILLQLQ